MFFFLQIEEYSRKQAELESKLNVASKRVSVLNHDVLILAEIKLPYGLPPVWQSCLIT